MDVALNNLQWLIYHKTRTNKTKIKRGKNKLFLYQILSDCTKSAG